MNKQFRRIFVTGDIHGDLDDLIERVQGIPDCSKEDLLIILGDCGFFYSVFFGREGNDFARQRAAARLPITILCVQGNHEQPFSEMQAQKIGLLGGEGYESQGIYFAANGTAIDLNGRRALVVGGAYSVDKPWRLARGSAWWEHEELSEEELERIYNDVRGQKFDFVLTHTCPYDFLPREVFLDGIDQSRVSHRTEHALQKIHDAIDFGAWYCGHFHTDKTEGKINFLYRMYTQII